MKISSETINDMLGAKIFDAAQNDYISTLLSSMIRQVSVCRMIGLMS